MQISDLLGKYSANVNTESGSRTAAAGNAVQKLVSGLGELKAGSVFEGTVGNVSNGQVTLLLSNGSSLAARIAGNVSLLEGQSMFFMVKSNDGSTIEIKPYASQNAGNPTLWSALDAAGLSSNEKNIAMVDAMMKEQMAIDRQSLAEMARILSNNPGVELDTAVQMTKLGLPVTEENAYQFENYKNDQGQILNKMTEILNEIPETLGNKELDTQAAVDLNNRIISILTDGAAHSGEEMQSFAAGRALDAGQTDGMAQQLAGSQDGGLEQTLTAGQTDETVQTSGAGQSGETVQRPGAEQAGNLTGEGAGETAAGKAGTAGAGQVTLQNVLTEEELSSLSEKLKGLTDENTASGLSKELKNLTSAEFLDQLKSMLSDPGQLDGKLLKSLFSSKAYRTVLGNAAEQNWLVKPEEVGEENRIKNLYEDLDKQMKQMDSLLKEMGLKNTDLAKSVSDLQGNMEFMNEINHAYSYLQIPLKMQNQNAHSDLYVYTNKKNLADQEGELSAFLHLDMENLGSTDVSVRMKGKSVNTKFYLEDDFSYELIMKNAEILEKRLEDKGFDCKIENFNDTKNAGFAETLMNESRPVSGGIVHRYSFDVRA